MSKGAQREVELPFMWEMALQYNAIHAMPGGWVGFSGGRIRYLLIPISHERLDRTRRIESRTHKNFGISGYVRLVCETIYAMLRVEAMHNVRGYGKDAPFQSKTFHVAPNQ